MMPTGVEDEQWRDDLEAVRHAKLARIAALGLDPWGQTVRRTPGHRNQIAQGTRPPLSLARRSRGPRCVSPRPDHAPQRSGEGGLSRPPRELDRRRIQIFRRQEAAGRRSEAGQLASELDLGDLLGVDGTLGYTKTGELTVFAESLTFLGKSLLPPPEKWHGLSDVEQRSRQRYVDLFSNPESMATFLGRSRILAAFRRVLAERGFVEVEGPTMQSIAGGAAARPFVTHHNTLDIDLYLRIALELHLKRLLVGGMERVFELGRVFRNEGISRKHNPEFTMLEAYQAYGDYHTMMDLTEALILAAIEAIGGGLVRRWGDATVDFTPPWPRRTYSELFREHIGVDPADPDAVRTAAESRGIATGLKDRDVLVGELFEAVVEDHCLAQCS